MNRYCTYESPDCTDEPAVMSGEEYANGGKAAIINADCYIWHFAENREEALAQHNEKFDEWEADVHAGRAEKRTY